MRLLVKHTLENEFITKKTSFLKAEQNTERRKRTVTSKFRETWNAKNGNTKIERYIYVKFSREDTHRGHFLGEVCDIYCFAVCLF